MNVTTPDRFVDQHLLQHGSDSYDPVKAREYYLRNRKLKGRTKGTVLDYLRTTQAAAKPAPTKSRIVTAKPLAKPKASVANPAVLRARMGKITVRISALKKVLDELMKRQKAEREAKANRDKNRNTSTATSRGSSSTSKSEKLTPKQEADKAKAAKAQYEKNKKTEPSKKDTLTGAELDAKIAEIRAVMRKAESELEVSKKALSGRG